MGASSGRVSRPISTDGGWKTMDPGREEGFSCRFLGGEGGTGDSRGVVDVRACVEDERFSDTLVTVGAAAVLLDLGLLPPKADMKESTVGEVSKGEPGATAGETSPLLRPILTPKKSPAPSPNTQQTTSERANERLLVLDDFYRTSGTARNVYRPIRRERWPGL